LPCLASSWPFLVDTVRKTSTGTVCHAGALPPAANTATSSSPSCRFHPLADDLMRQFAVALLLLATVHAQQHQRVRSSQLPGKAHRKTRMLSTPTCTDTAPDCGPGWMCSCTSGRRLFGAPAGAVCTCIASYMPPSPPAFSIDMNGWSNLGPGSAYNPGSFGTPPVADNANCASAPANEAGLMK